MANNKRKVVLLLVVAVFLAVALVQVVRMKRNSPGKTDLDYIRLVPEIMQMIKQKYVEEVSDKKLVEGAINGMLAALDPHSAYLPADSFREMNIQITGSFGGLGLEVNLIDGRLTVISPIDDTPAFRAGIKSGDVIWKIDEKLTRNLNITEAVNRMRGPKGTRVTLTILRKKAPKPLVFNLVRDIINTKSVRARTLEPGYGYVRISHFQERSDQEFGAALQTLRRANGGTLKGLVIDLRNNPGGLLEQVVDIAGHFIDAGSNKGLIVYTEGREESSRMSLTAGTDGKEPRYPVVVLINGGSASASEILAGALQDHKRAVVMGTQSFGKGSVQSIFPLAGGAGLKLTTALYYTPKGRSIQAKGITPDIIVGNGEIAAAPATKGPEIRERDLENHIEESGVEPGVEEPAPAGKPDGKGLKDYQLARALDLLKGMQIISKESK
ncbi:MAG TPA: S41 family peptidase [Geobacteraceae bacterium]|nr:S41 family peptidase [Geobacteraceae bacterium]